MENGVVALAKKLHRFLFDFSASQNNRREVEDILLAALAQSKTDAEFTQALRRIVFDYEGDKVEGETRYYGFNRFMTQNRRLSDRDRGIRLRAEHLLEDLPRIYGGKKEPAVPSSRCTPPKTPKEVAEPSHQAYTKENNADV